LSLAGYANSVFQSRGHGRIRLTIIKLLVVAEQLVTKLVVPALECRASSQVGDNAAGSHDEQRIGFTLFAAPCGELLANPSQSRIERVTRSQRPEKIVGSKDDLFGLNDDSKFGAFDINRAATRAVRAFIGDQSVPFVLRLLRLYPLFKLRPF